jgi:ubiquinone biosynthesis protein
MHSLIPKKFKTNGAVRPMAERLRIVIEELGPTFVKFGQILADRPDIVSQKLCAELKKLQSQTEPIDHLLAAEMIMEELGGPLEHYFSEIDFNACIGSASIGQVYKGRLLSGEVVVVKIQRPDIEDKIELDLQLLKYLAKQLIEEYPGLTAVDILGFVDEFGETLKLEMNYMNEAANVVRFIDMFKDIPYCKIPRVYLEYSTPRVLVMEYITGVLPDNAEELTRAGLDPHEVAVNGINIILTMVFKHGFFHADPHPGNLFVQEGNRIALIDFGMVGNLKPSQMQFLAGFILGLAKNDAHIITEALLVLCDKKFFAEREDLEFYVHDMLTRHGAFHYEKMNFTQILNESIKIILRYQLRIPASIYLLLKALATIEKFGSKLDAHISLPIIIKPYAEEMVKERISVASVAHDIFDTFHDYISLIRDFPAEMNEILFKLKHGKLVHEIHLGDQHGWGQSTRNMARFFVIALLLGFMLTAAVIVSVWGRTPWIGNVLLVFSAFFSVGLLAKLFIRTSI